MILRPSAFPVRGILLDIEGTTTPIAFVTQVLFPFVRTHMPDFLERQVDSEGVRADLARLLEEHAVDARRDPSVPRWRDDPVEARADSALAYANWLMDRDRKSTGLKSIQGRIWFEGYRDGRLRGQVFPDVPPALERWQRNGLDVRIFSSGSVLAQQLLFGHSEAGDLTRFLHGYFDTTTGSKTEIASYRSIADSIGIPPPEILFISDTATELDAARSAGLSTLMSIRPGNSPQRPGHRHPTTASFAGIAP